MWKILATDLPMEFGIGNWELKNGTRSTVVPLSFPGASDEKSFKEKLATWKTEEINHKSSHRLTPIFTEGILN